MKNLISVCMLFMLAGPVFAVDSTEMAKIKEPITKIYDLMKSVISLVAIIAITGAGALYMISGNNISQRESAKSWVSYAVVGLVLVWVAPMLVTYLTAA